MNEPGSRPPPENAWAAGAVRLSVTPGQERTALAPAAERRHPLRFVWQIDDDGRFTIDSDEFVDLAGPRTAATLAKPWPAIAAALDLDPDGRIERAMATRNTWSGLCAAWPVAGMLDRLAVELSGLPVYDRERSFRGYRGFGVCRDLVQLGDLTRIRHADSLEARPSTAVQASSRPAPAAEERAAPRALVAIENVVPFRTGPGRGSELPAGPAQNPPLVPDPGASAQVRVDSDARQVFDRFPVGVLIYRLSELVYANRAFLDWAGQETIASLTHSGGLDSLFVEPGADPLADDEDAPFTMASPCGSDAVEARLLPIEWEGESAFALVTTPTASTSGPTHGHAAASDVEADRLAKIGHDMRGLLTDIIEISEVVLEERLGPLGDRYRHCLKDIHTSGRQLISVLDGPAQPGLGNDRHLEWPGSLE